MLLDKEHESMLDELLKLDAGLTPWELNFLNDLWKRFLDDENNFYTRKQFNKLEAIWNERMK